MNAQPRWVIVWHWTAGTHKPSDYEKRRYHFLIDGDGNVIPGLFPPEANIPPLREGHYAPHTRNFNSRAISISLSAMRGARERPFNPGDAPITDAQVASLVRHTATVGRQYKVPVSRETMLSHAEVQPTLGIRQDRKWDITWLPGMDATGDAIVVGDRLRAMVAKEIAPKRNFTSTLKRIFGGFER